MRTGSVLAGIRIVGLSAALLLAGTLTLARDDATRQSRASVDPPCERPFALGEFGTDVVVTARLSHPPRIGETAVLFVGVCARADGVVRLDIELPDGFDWERPPPGMTTSQRVSVKPENQGCLDVATGRWALAARQPLGLTATVVARKPGFATLNATARAESSFAPDYSALVFVTVGEDGRPSYFGYRGGTEQRTATRQAAERSSPSCG